MIRSGLIALRLLNKTREQHSNPLHPITARREFSSKETATRIAQDAGRIAQNSTKVLARVFEELWNSNEVKLVRLSAIRGYALGQKLFDEHVLKNPNLQSVFDSMKAKLGQMQTTVAEAKQEVAKKAKKIDLPVPKKEELKKEEVKKEEKTEGKGETDTKKKEQSGEVKN